MSSGTLALPGPELRDAALAELVVSLQAQAHEYENRIHAISGLLALEMTSEAEALLAQYVDEQRGGSAEIAATIEVPAVAGLLVAKRAAAASRKVTLTLEEGSGLYELPAGVSDLDALSLVGNLVDNAIDAAAEWTRGDRRVEVGVFDGSEQLLIRVSDSGGGLAAADRERICAAGESSKPGHHGLGLTIVTGLLGGVGGRLEARADGLRSIFEAVIPNQRRDGCPSGH